MGMSILNLLWIVPVAAAIGAFVMALAVAANDERE
jgi:hypothetical protein